MPFSGTRKEEYKDCPIYNEEVNSWYYEVYVKQGEKETLVTATTSWAAYVVDAPLNGVDQKFQIGVRSVGLDGKTVSPIVWSDEIESDLSTIETLTIDKDIIKPNEEVTIGFEDPNHPTANIDRQQRKCIEINNFTAFYWNLRRESSYQDEYKRRVERYCCYKQGITSGNPRSNRALTNDH